VGTRRRTRAQGELVARKGDPRIEGTSRRRRFWQEERLLASAKVDASNGLRIYDIARRTGRQLVWVMESLRGNLARAIESGSSRAGGWPDSAGCCTRWKRFKNRNASTGI